MLRKTLSALLLPAVGLLVATPVARADDLTRQPVLSGNGLWVPILLIIIAGLFLAAAVIGPVVRVNLGDELPLTHAHDEPPGASHHHGRSGTHNPPVETEKH